MKNVVYGFLLTCMISIVGCQLGAADESIEPIIDPIPLMLVDRDSISAGGYLGVRIEQAADVAYTAVQAHLKNQGIAHLNIVGNVSSELSQLKSRIPLYSYVLLDKNEGTDSGVQITLEAGKVKDIYLNSGEKLSQWPQKENAKSSIRVGDEAGDLHEKMIRIREIKQYAATFEHIVLLTKDLTTPFDPAMAQSPQWYFAYTTAAGLLEVVNIHLKNGKVAYMGVERYKK